MRNLLVIILNVLLLMISTVSQADVISWISQPDRTISPVLNGSTSEAKISANGQYMVFKSTVSNLVANDVNQRSDVFFYDRINETRQKITLPQSIGFFSAPTSDGRYVLIKSSDDEYVYLVDLQTNAQTLINTDSNGQRFEVRNDANFLSESGDQWIFATQENLSPLHTDNKFHIYQKDLSTGSYQLLSLADNQTDIADNTVYLMDVSPNGRFIVAISRAGNIIQGVDLSAADNNLVRLDLVDGSYTLVSAQPDGRVSDSDAFHIEEAVVSNSGHVAFITDQDDLVVGDNNNDDDVFYFNGSTNTRISLTPAGQEIFSFFRHLMIDANAGFISYSSRVDALVEGDGLGHEDVFLYTVSTGLTERVSSNSHGMAANGESTPAGITVDGHSLMFISSADDLTGQAQDTFLDRIYLYSTDSHTFSGPFPNVTQSIQTSITGTRNTQTSADQQVVFYQSASPYLSFDAPSDLLFSDRYSNYAIHALDRSTDTHRIIARKTESNLYSVSENTSFDVSSSGQYITFVSRFSQPDGLIELGSAEVFIYDRWNDTYTQIMPGINPKVNDKGLVVFETEVDLAPEDNNSHSDVYVYIPSNHSIHLVSLPLSGMTDSFGANDPDISDSGDDIWIAFVSASDDFINGDNNNSRDAFIINWPTGGFKRVSQLSDGTGGDRTTFSKPAISYNGDFVLFSSAAQNLTNNDYTNASLVQLFLYERRTQEITLVSKTGGLPFESDIYIREFDLSESGRFVTYAAQGELNEFGDYDRFDDVFLYDGQTKMTQLVTTASNDSSFYRSEVVEDLNLSPPLIGVVFDGSGAYTGIANHPGHNESFLYQQGGPNVELTLEVMGMGVITGSFGINCMTQCTTNYPLGAQLNIVAQAEPGYVFYRWSSNRSDCYKEPSCAVNMDREKTIQAIFLDANDMIFDNGFE